MTAATTAVDNPRKVAPNQGAMTLFALAKVVPADPSFPPRLRGFPNAPAQLWVTGRLPVAAPARPAGPLFGASPPDAPAPRAPAVAVAIVGARAATGGGCSWARDLASALAKAGIAVVSGGAFGIDAAAHEGALGAGGVTFAVLGCGVDVAYPDRHAELFARIATSGGLLSEYPPGTSPRPGQFPARNRIIAALCDLVVVVETAHRSGALGTAKWARALGIPVAARPGSAGTDGLIGRKGAIAVADPADVFAVLTGRSPSSGARVAASAGHDNHDDVRFAAGSAQTQRLLAVLRATEPAAAEELAQRLDWRLPKVLGVLGEAEIEGWIRRVPGGAYEVSRAH